MSSYNKLLKQQMAEYLGKEEIPAKYVKLFKAINKTYDQHEREYKMIDRSVEWSSAEMMKLNSRLVKESILLKETEHDMNTMFENTETVFFSLDVINNRFKHVSAACEKVYGYTPYEWANDSTLWRGVIHPDDLHLLQGHDEKMETGKRAFYEYRIIRKDGSIRWVEVKITPTLDNTGTLIRKDGVVNDITRKKESDQKIIQAERLLNEAQQLASMGSWNVDIIKNEITWSDGFRKIMGIDADYPIGTESFIALLHPEDKERVSAQIFEVMKTGIMQETICRIIRFSDSQERTLQTKISSIKNAKGELLRIYGISRDITDRKDAELKIEDLSMLIYQISHDLRGPLNSAKNYIYLALKRVSDVLAHEYLTKIHDSYAKMEHRVLSLLDLQRINRSELNIEEIDLHLLIKDIISSIDGIKGFNEIKINTDIDIPNTLYSDKQFLHSIFHNLINNATTYRRPINDSCIDISAKVNGGKLVVIVSDNGQGVSDNMKNNLFKKFAKGDTSTNGTGLGLYIVKSLVSKLKGDINCESELGKGTSFTIKLPLN